MAAGYRAESIGKLFHIAYGTVGDPQSRSVSPRKDHVIDYVSPRGQTIGKIREGALFNEFELPDEDGWDSARTLPRGLAWGIPRRS